MTFDLSMVVQLVGYAVGACVLYFGLRALITALQRDVLDLAKEKVDKVECISHHGELDARHAELKSDLRVLRGGIKVLHDGLRDAGTLKNPPELPPEFYEEE